MGNPGTYSAPRFLRWPEPKAIGDSGRGQRILSGVLTVAGRDLAGDPFAVPDLPFSCQAALHRFGWLDDLAAVAGQAARDLARQRVADWLALHADPAEDSVIWLPETAAARLLRWLFHAGMILPGADAALSRRFHAALHQHLSWLLDRWPATPDGLPRLESLTALFLGALHLQGGDLPPLALLSLAEEAEAMGQGVLLASRSGDDLLAALSLLVWASDAAYQAGLDLPDGLSRVMAVLASILRGLRHADGGLAQFHGSSRGVAGRLDQMLAAAPGPAVTTRGPALGFQRLARGRVTVILDGAAPPDGDAAHASALAFEMVDARQPLILSCGPGAGFGPLWAEATRRTHCHSAVLLAGQPSARFLIRGDAPDRLENIARDIWAGDYDVDGRLLAHASSPAHAAGPAHVLAGHDGWVPSHGVTHLRELWLAESGDSLTGQDSLAAVTPEARQRLQRFTGGPPGAAGLGFDIRFHLHPAILPAPMGATVDLTLPDGRCWRFSHDLQDDATSLRIEPSVWLDPAQGVPVSSHQIVLSGVLRHDAIQIGWTLARSRVS